MSHHPMAAASFSSVLIGEGSLVIACADILLSRGHVIHFVVSPDEQVLEWARKAGISCFSQDDEWNTHVETTAFDILFSIVNYQVLNEEVLRRPRRLAINYHDALLPRYAGGNASSWALINREAKHGVTWHVMTASIDAGNILKQCAVDIGEGETALSLNMKCYEAAQTSFVQLVEDLERGSDAGVEQDLAERTYYSPHRRPPSDGIISFHTPAGQIDAMVRALSFGPYPNPLGCAKLLFGDVFLVVAETRVLGSTSEFRPGTIVGMDEDALRVCAIDKEIEIRKFCTLDGIELKTADVIARFHLEIGWRFADLDQSALLELSDYAASLAKHERFWVGRLARLQPVSLPYAQQAAGAAHGATQRKVSTVNSPVVFDGQLPEGCEDKQGDILLAAYLVYIARVTGVWEFDVGLMVDDARGISSVLRKGLYSSVVPWRVRLDPAKGFWETLSATRAQLRTTKRRATYAYDVVARYPRLSAAKGPDGRFLPLVIDDRDDPVHCEDSCPGPIVFAPGKHGGGFTIMYGEGVLDDGRVASLSRHLSALVEAACSRRDQPIDGLPLVSRMEQESIVLGSHGPVLDGRDDRCIHHVFEEQVGRTPDAVALVAGERCLTYRELNARANRLAHHLRGLGAGPETLVALRMERSLEMVIGILAILKAGGAYVPLDPKYPQERLAFMLEDSRAPLLLTHERLSAGPPAHGIRTVCVDAELSGIEGGSDETPISGVTADNLAYVMYTSGSTGKPKGVCLEHRNTVTLVNWAGQVFEPEDLAGVLFSTSICFDLSIFELFAPLSVGGKIILVENILHLPTVPPDRNVTLVNTVPSLISELLRDASLPPSVRTVSLCGEPLSEAVVQQIRRNDHVEKIINLYGPTETTTYSTWVSIPRGARGTPTIGRPISNTKIYVLDKSLQPVPVGLPGELYIGGGGVARGYLGRPELTAERFVADPFGHEPVSRLYRTGDLARYLPDGDLEFLGRMDQQIKIRGFRVELGEIESVLCRHPGVREAVVVAREDVPGGKRLVAYIVPGRAQEPTPAELRDHLARTVPDYMVPAAFMTLDALPQTPNGKVDRKALPRPDTIGAPPGQAYAAPRTPTEELLAAIWADILKVERVGIHDNFFELGGNSLLVLRLISRIRKDLEVMLPLNVVFEAPTIEQMSAVVRGETSGASAGPLSSRVGVRDTPFVCLSWGPTLAGHLGGYPVYPLDLDSTEIAAITSIEETAGDLIERLRGLQPEGPYLLGGFCRMGVLAFEMAQQLLTQGEEVALLVLFDAPPLTLREHRPGFVRRSSKDVGKLVTLLRGWTSGDPAVRFGDVVRKVRNRTIRFIDGLPLPAVRTIRGGVAGDMVPKQVIDRYEPRVYPGQIKLVRSVEDATRPEWDSAGTWGLLARGGLDVWDVPGNHVSMFEKPHIQTLAARLRPHLEEANEACRRARMGRQGVNGVKVPARQGYRVSPRGPLFRHVR